MRLSAMRYKTFVWPHNPRTYAIEYQRTMAVNKVPYGRYQLQDLGPTRRILRGEGEFVGEEAYAQFQALAYGGAPGRSTPIALERPGPAGGSALLDWDLAVERDARRYDGPFPLY